MPTMKKDNRRRQPRPPGQQNDAPGEDPFDGPAGTITVPGTPDLIIKVNHSYAKLGVARGWDPTPAQRLRLWITSMPGEGKTSFIMSNPHALVLDFEDSTRDVIGSTTARTV